MNFHELAATLRQNRIISGQRLVLLAARNSSGTFCRGGSRHMDNDEQRSGNRQKLASTTYPQTDVRGDGLGCRGHPSNSCKGDRRLRPFPYRETEALRMGRRSAYSTLGLGGERCARSADGHGRDESRQGFVGPRVRTQSLRF